MRKSEPLAHRAPNPKLGLILLTLCPLLLAGCHDGGGDSEEVVSLDAELEEVIVAQALTGDPSAGRDLPDISDPKAQLGMKLFFTRSLGGEMGAACVTCHHPVLGGGDNLSLSVGVDAMELELLGEGRKHDPLGEHYDGGPPVPRNAPTTFNMGLWDKVLFHDGRVESLGGTPGMNGNDGLGIRTPDSLLGVGDPDAGENLTAAQARFPVTSPEEMKDFVDFNGLDNDEVRDNLAERLGGYGSPAGGSLSVNDWLDEFRVAYDDPTGTAEELVTFDHIAEAIAEYENSQVFVDTPWRAYVQGDRDALSDAAKRGALLFFREQPDGGADCASCHSGDFFTDELFHVIAMPQIGRGKGDGASGDEDFGRFRETGISEDMYAFRTPSLLNVGVTGPWGHAGAYTSLEATVRHHLNAEAAVATYDYSQLDPNIQAFSLADNTENALATLRDNRANELFSLQDVELSDAEVDDLLAFLEALTDPCTLDRDCIGEWIPDASDTNPDAMRINGVDSLGHAL